MVKLIFIRHGETSKNITGVLHDYNDIEGLSDNGRHQIELTANKLKELSPNKIYSSGERRALESAEIISKWLNIQTERIEGIQERNWGIFTGKPWSEIKVVLDPMNLDNRYCYIPKGGESWKQFEKRLIKAVKKVLDQNKEQTVIIVTHGGAIRALMPFLLNLPKEESFKYDPSNASISIFEYLNNNFRSILLDDISHLG